VKATLFTDGGARGNPGPAGIGVVLRDEQGTVMGEIAESIGHTTNNVAEYRALIAGLELALAHGVSELEVLCDSQLVVSQVQGRWKIKKETLRPLAVQARALLGRFESVRLRHVGREWNQEADRLANQGMDAAALEDPEPPEQSSLLG
jgi:ribonuclease HI